MSLWSRSDRVSSRPPLEARLEILACPDLSVSPARSVTAAARHPLPREVVTLPCEFDVIDDCALSGLPPASGR
jgi:hypothetical protein